MTAQPLDVEPIQTDRNTGTAYAVTQDGAKVATMWGPAVDDSEVWFVRVGNEPSATRHSRQEGEALLRLAAEVAEARRAGGLHLTKTRLALLYDTAKGQVARRTWPTSPNTAGHADVHLFAERTVTNKIAEQERAGWVELEDQRWQTVNVVTAVGYELRYWAATPTGEMVLRLEGVPVPERRAPVAGGASHAG